MRPYLMNLAGANMKDQLVGVAIVLLIGTLIVVAMARAHSGATARSYRWIPIASLIIGPVLAFLGVAIAALLAARRSDRIAVSDAWAALPPVLLIGTIGGVAASVTFTIALRLTARREATADPSDENDR